VDIQIYYWNVSGKWSDKFKEICKDDAMLNPCFDIITIAEPGECAHTINSCTIPNYSMFYPFYSFSPGRQDGGILVYVRDRLLPHTTILETNDCSYVSKIWMKIGNKLLLPDTQDPPLCGGKPTENGAKNVTTWERERRYTMPNFTP
jgi:hypothetical protein